VARYKFVVGFWLCVFATAWTLSGIGAGLNAIANNGKYVNDVMIPTLVLLAALAALFIRPCAPISVQDDWPLQTRLSIDRART
jgi:hypothetical protein